MEDLKGYQIQKEAVFENGRGFALAHNPEAQSPFVIWHFTVMPEGERNYYGYTACRGILPPEKEFERFLFAYDYVYKVPQLPEAKGRGERIITGITPAIPLTRMPSQNQRSWGCWRLPLTITGRWWKAIPYGRGEN